jgi:hypothetical protein
MEKELLNVVMSEGARLAGPRQRPPPSRPINGMVGVDVDGGLAPSDHVQLDDMCFTDFVCLIQVVHHRLVVTLTVGL